MLRYRKLLQALLILFFLLFSFSLFAQVPVVNSFSPVSGPVGTAVTIRGAGFSAGTTANSVYFGPVKATVTAASDTSIVATVPPGATYQLISVTNAGKLTAFSTTPFITTIAVSAPLVATSFSAYSTYATTTSPSDATPCDLDGDGKADIICSTTYYGNINILRNTSTAGLVSFAPRIEIEDPSWYRSTPFTIGDVDGDGKKDLIALYSYSGKLFIFRNTSVPGAISFAAPVQVTAMMFGIRPMVADFDRDGKVDIAYLTGNSFAVVRNTTTGSTISFAAQVYIAATGSTPDMVISDFNADGKPDVALTDNTNNKIYVFPNTSTPGNIAFATRIDLAANANSVSLIISGDVDGDGSPDLAASYSSTGEISLYKNTTSSSNISFSRQADIANTTAPSSLGMGNVNGDDKPDLMIGVTGASVISLFQNTTTGTSFSFAPKKDYAVPTAANAIAACDVDNDGKTDLFTSGSGANLISVLRYSQNEPYISNFTPTSGRLGSSISIFGSNFTGATRVAAGDSAVSSFTVLTDTSITAIIGNGATGNITVSNATGTGVKAGFTYRQPPVISSFTPLSSAAGSTITLTGSGFAGTPQNNIVYFGQLKGTVVSASTTQLTVTVPVGATYAPLSVYNGTSTGTSAKYFTPVNLTAPVIAGSFALPVQVPGTNGFGISLSWGDMNNDGKPDLVYYGNGPSISLNRSTPGNALFDSPLEFGYGSGFTVPILADISGDGLPDVIGLNSGANTLGVYKNASVNGSMAMGIRYDFATGSNTGYAAAGDMDGDGRTDIVVTNSSANTISIFLNTTMGSAITMAPRVDFATGSNPQHILITDFDQDGKPDIAVVNSSSPTSVSVFKNTTVQQGIVSFAPRVDYATANNAYYIGVADADGDGLTDIAVSSFNSSTASFLRNISTTGNLLFSQRMDITTSGKLGGIGFGDMNGDSKPDMLIGPNEAKTISYFKNTGTSGTISFDTAITIGYSLGGNSRELIAADVDGDGKTDIIDDDFGPYYLRNKINEPPTIISFSPATAGPGDTLLINGKNLSGLTAISFGGVATNAFSLLSDTTLQVIFGTGTSGNVGVTTPYGTASLPGFTVLSIPVVSSFSPVAGPVGSVVTIAGGGFSPTLTDNLVSFGPSKAQVVTASATALTVLVPKGATGQKLWVTVNGRTGFSTLPFQATFAGAAPVFAATYFDTTNRVVVAAEASVWGLTAFDIDEDGKTDIALASSNSSYNYHFYAFKGVGTGTYLSYTQSADLKPLYYSDPAYPLSVDVNGDGKTDIGIDANNDGYPAAVFPNQSTPGNLSLGTLVKIYGPALSNARCQYADFDGDGRPDVAVKSVYSNSIIICRNTSTLTTISFAAAISIGSVGTAPAADTKLLPEDFNGDGRPDLGVVANNNLYIFVNTGARGKISFAVPLTILNEYGRAAVADLDGDGRLDIVQVLNRSGSLVLTYLRNTSNGTTLSFAPAVTIVTSAGNNGVGGLTAADMDGDGKPDICVNGYALATTLSIFKNTSVPGAVSFLPKVDYPAVKASEIYVSDIDNDGKPDLLTTSLNSNTVSILRNRIGEPLPIQLCPPVASTSITAGITGTTYQWQVDTGTGFINIVNNANYSGTNTATLQLINIPAAWYGYKYLCTASGTNSNTFVLQFLNNWRGTTSSDWNNPANWSCGALPDGNTDVIISSGTVVITANAICRTLLVKPGATVSVNPGVTLTITH